MGKSTKLCIICSVFIIICLIIMPFIDDIVDGIINDQKCDYCGADARLKSGGTEYCHDCFNEYDGNFWN